MILKPVIVIEWVIGHNASRDVHLIPRKSHRIDITCVLCKQISQAHDIM